MKRLPIGIQTFSEIIENNYVYIDKTKEAYELILDYKYTFLSRPRRFGKSLFLDTLKNIFEGNKELFRGLYIYDKYDFEKYPVIKIDWAGDFKTLESTKNIANFILKNNQEKLSVVCESKEPDICFAELIQKTYKKYSKKVVILIDEYDKPILDNIDNLDRANENRDFLRNLYVHLKSNDEFIHFAFLTGISKFSKASIFSGLNNLVDITLLPKYGNICGYTHKNIEDEFQEFSKEFDIKKVKNWYNGYYFLKDRIYNPFDILQLFSIKQFKNYWFESGNPYFLIEMLKKKPYYIPQLENLVVGEDLLNSFDIEHLKLEVLLYQAGYLTIDETVVGFDDIQRYKLKVPNREVQISLNKLFIDYLIQKSDDTKRQELFEAFSGCDMDKLKNTLTSLFASIPYNNYTKNLISQYDGYYASIVYIYLASLGLKLIAEDVTSTGRIDITLFINNKIYIIEFKVDEKGALKQIKEKRYFEKYLQNQEEIYLVGIEFDSNSRNVAGFEWEKVDR
jgi:hypothetical protein